MIVGLLTSWITMILLSKILRVMITMMLIMKSSVTSDLECNMPAMNVLYKKQKLEDLLFILYQVMVIVYFHQCHISCQTSVNSLSMLVYVTRYTKTWLTTQKLNFSYEQSIKLGRHAFLPSESIPGKFCSHNLYNRWIATS